MELTTVRVPGKVMLSGEYSVLNGGSAVLLPVPHHLVVSERQDAPGHSYSPVVAAARTFPVQALSEYEAAPPPADTPVNSACLHNRGLGTCRIILGHGLPHLEINNSGFYHLADDGTRKKYGLGSSAAEAVGVIALRFERAGLPWERNIKEIERIALEVHRNVQGGRGSGADVAVCARRRPIRFRKAGDKYRVKTIKPSPAHIPPLTLAWTGRSADTRVMVDSFESWIRAGNEADRELLNRLVESSHQLADAWFRKPLPMLLELLERYTETMETCAIRAGIEYTLPIHREIAAWARAKGGFAKPTGAGGGDMILLVGELPLHETGLEIIPLDPFSAAV